MTRAKPAGGGIPGGAPGPGPGAAPLPAGFGVVIDPGTRQLDEDILFGGAPARVLRLSGAGRTALAELRAGPVRSDAAGRLARKLTDAGLAHPRPPELTSRPDVTVLIPVRDRAVLLDRCLSALGHSYPAVVVDDGSADPGAVADVAAAHGAVLVRREVNGGPGAARNTGLLGVTTDVVAFLDSDCVPEPGWIERLAAHLADPAVAAAAPRPRLGRPLHHRGMLPGPGRRRSPGGAGDPGGLCAHRGAPGPACRSRSWRWIRERLRPGAALG